MSRLIVYRGYGSPPSRAVLMLSELIGIQPEIREVNLRSLEHKSPEFTKLNPTCTVPVLQDGDFVLFDSNAIMKYLLEKYGGDKRETLYPGDLRTRALVDQTMFFNTGIFFPAFLSVIRAAFSNKQPTGTSPVQVQSIDSSYFALDACLQDKKYIAANHMTIADLAAGSTATVMQVAHKVDPEKYPRCTEWLARLEEEQVFKTINAPGATFITQQIKLAWERNKKKN